MKYITKEELNKSMLGDERIALTQGFKVQDNKHKLVFVDKETAAMAKEFVNDFNKKISMTRRDYIIYFKSKQSKNSAKRILQANGMRGLDEQ